MKIDYRTLTKFCMIAVAIELITAPISSNVIYADKNKNKNDNKDKLDIDIDIDNDNENILKVRDYIVNTESSGEPGLTCTQGPAGVSFKYGSNYWR